VSLTALSVAARNMNVEQLSAEEASRLGAVFRDCVADLSRLVRQLERRAKRSYAPSSAANFRRSRTWRVSAHFRGYMPLTRRDATYPRMYLPTVTPVERTNRVTSPRQRLLCPDTEGAHDERRNPPRPASHEHRISQTRTSSRLGCSSGFEFSGRLRERDSPLRIDASPITQIDPWPHSAEGNASFLMHLS
jgi:hypothetical protein